MLRCGEYGIPIAKVWQNSLDLPLASASSAPPKGAPCQPTHGMYAHCARLKQKSMPIEND